MTITLGTTGRYERGVQLLQQFATLSPDRSRGMVHRRNLQPRQRREWVVPFSYLDSTELTAIVNEYNTAKGSAGRVNFVPPGATYTIPVRFVENSLTFETVSPTHYRATYRVVEDAQI